MRTYTILLTCAVLAMFYIESSDAVACSATILTDCTDCSDGANVDNADCTTTTTTTTTLSPVTLRNNKRIVRVSNLRYTNYHRVRVNGGTSATGNSSSRNRSSRNARVRVIRG